MKHLVRLLVGTFLMSLAAASLAAAQTRGVTPADYYAFEVLSDPRFSPDGSTIAFVLTTVGQKANRRRGEIWTVPGFSCL
jgi:hypothetical protein